MNSVSLVGRLGRDPETRYTSGGKSVANFAIAVDDGFGEKKTTSWITIVAWEKTAELAQKYLVKGSQVAVEGRLRQRSYENKSGEKVSVLEVIANRLDFLTKAEKSNNREPGDDKNEFDAPAAAEEVF